ncbi:hypothetical protein Hanom_Chr17g01525241 [Helianthus anomalus]
MQFSGNGDQVEVQASDGVGVGHGQVERSPVGVVPSPHADSPKVHGEKGHDAAIINEERDSLSFVSKACQQKSVGGGPEVSRIFKCGSGEKVGRPRRRCALGQRLSAPKAHRVVNGSPEDVRPKKRSRGLTEEEVPGFGYVGFTSRVGHWRERGERN